jgi:hypothetical protein
MIVEPIPVKSEAAADSPRSNASSLSAQYARFAAHRGVQAIRPRISRKALSRSVILTLGDTIGISERTGGCRENFDIAAL